ncbi:MAG: DUF262 domain-containing protein [Pseudomonadales bacterium]
MKIKATDPDIFSICNRIEKGMIDLKPEFQRGDVWNSSKKKLLIDSILRDWQVPPIHVIRVNGAQEVLDGQQRLRAIYDFYTGCFSVNGNIEPYNEEIFRLHGLLYKDLSDDLKMHFDLYSIRVFEIAEYASGEPGELFNRLNNALNLTSAEKRNAYVGQVTSQAKELVGVIDEGGLDKSFLGFSNNRMAYDDLLIKICFMLEEHGLSTKVTDKSLSDRYKADAKFPDDVFRSVKRAIELLSDIRARCLGLDVDVHVTKATAFTWIYFIAKIYRMSSGDIDAEAVISAFISFEGGRFKYRDGGGVVEIPGVPLSTSTLESIFELYNYRASSKVMTLESMLIRESVVILFYTYICGGAELDEESRNVALRLSTLLSENSDEAKHIVSSFVLDDASGRPLL